METLAEGGVTDPKFLCSECKVQNHRNCFGAVIREGGMDGQLCECVVCVRRFEQNLKRILENPPDRRESSKG